MTQNTNFQKNVSSGFAKLDEMTGGWHAGEFAIIAGRPAMGKTALAHCMALNMAVDYGCAVAYFSLEQSNVQTVKRMVKLGDWKTIPDEKHEGRLRTISPMFYDVPLFIDDTSALSKLEFCEKCRKLKSENNIKVVIIDYLQLMNWSGRGKGYEQELLEIAQALKAIAEELNITVIAFSQMDRSVDKRTGGRPVVSDLLYGGFEQYADTILLLYRPEYYRIYEDSEGVSLKGIADIIVAKNRNGVLGDARLRFNQEIPKFENIEEWNNI